MTMKLFIAVILAALALVYAQPSADPLMEGFRLVEVASVATAATLARRHHDGRRPFRE